MMPLAVLAGWSYSNLSVLPTDNVFFENEMNIGGGMMPLAVLAVGAIPIFRFYPQTMFF